MRSFPIAVVKANWFTGSDIRPTIHVTSMAIRSRVELVYWMFPRLVRICPLPTIELAMHWDLSTKYVFQVCEITKEYFSGGSWLNRKIGGYMDKFDFYHKLTLRCAWLTNEIRAIEVIEKQYHTGPNRPCRSRLDFILRLRKLSKHPFVRK